MVPVDLRRVLGKREPRAVGHPLAGEELDGLLRSSGPVSSHQDPPAGPGPMPTTSKAREITSMWSATVFDPALPGRSTSAAHSPPPSGPWSNHAVSGW